MTSVKFVQIIAGSLGTLYGLDDKGRVWNYGPRLSAGMSTIAAGGNAGTPTQVFFTTNEWTLIESPMEAE